MKYDNIEWARKQLELPEVTDIADIRNAFHTLSMKYHPDRCEINDRKHCTEKFIQLKAAYDILLNYVSQYKISFKKEDVRKNFRGLDYADFIERFYNK